MIKNYFKTTFRNLWKTKGYSFLNIFGLAIGITAAALIFLWVEDETSFDEFPNKEHIYITKSSQTLNGVTNVSDAVPGLLGPAMKNEIPGVRYAARLAWETSDLFSFGDNRIFQTGYYAEPDVLDIFSLAFVAGDKATAMDGPDKVVLTESAARRLFGDEPAIGKMVQVAATDQYMVSGVVKDLPRNSTFRFDWLIPFEVYEQQNPWIRQWRNNVLMTFVALEPTADVGQVNSMLDDFVIRQSPDEQLITHNSLYPLERMRLYNRFDSDGHEQEGRMRYVRLFSIIAWVVLVIACINFMNLATARSDKRAKEVGMRKVIGSTRIALIGQFLGESLILATLSALLAVGLTQLILPLFNSMVGKELAMQLVHPMHVAFLGGVILVCGLLSGIYPALYLSSFTPLATLKGLRHQVGAAGSVRRALVILQYTASITLIICTVVIYQQIQHAKGRDIGYERSQVLLTPVGGQMSQSMEALKEQLIATGAVESAGVSQNSMIYIGMYSWNVDWDGRSPDQRVNIYNTRADADLLTTMGMELVAGRNFRPQMLGDSASVIVNETFAKLIRPDGDVVGTTITNAAPFTIVGVVKDFVFNNVYGKPEPFFFWPFEAEPWGELAIRTKAGVDLSETIPQIEKIIKAYNPEFPFSYSFLDQQFDQQFQSEALIQKLAGIFASLSIIISCIGLFGLAAFTAERRTKEMGVRKVLGASVTSLVNLLNREFAVLVLISCVVAFPIAWWIMSDWLGSYAYHTDLNWWLFALVGCAALLIALLTVSSQAVKAALTNPTKSLRDE